MPTPSHGTHHRLLSSLVTTLAIVLLATTASTALPVGSAVSGSHGGFVDDNGSTHEGAINAIAETGLVRGCNPPTNDRFCPDRSITRAEMATILARVGGWPAVETSTFVDIASSVHRAAIDTIAARDVTRGCNPPVNNLFCPEKPVTRGEAASLIARALDFDPDGPTFSDSPQSVHREYIGALAKRDILRGCNPPANTQICPNRDMTRGELASVIARALELEPIDDPGDDGGTDSPGFLPEYPGQPAPGTVLWGAHIEGNGDPYLRHERDAGAKLGINRTYYQWNQRTASGLSSHLDSDRDNGRVSWVSFKVPSCGQGCDRWADMASGARDSEIDQLLRTLEAEGHPVWLTVHHEPENDLDADHGDPQDHLAMNRRVRQRMEALGTKNVTLVLVLMGWTWDPLSGRDPNSYWDGRVYDVIGIDPYVCIRNYDTCQHHSLLDDLNSNERLVDPTKDGWKTIRAWAADRGVDMAVAEWGMRGTDADAGQRVREWFEAAAKSHNDGGGARVVALSAFDTTQNDPNNQPYGWLLRGSQLSVFRDLLGSPMSSSGR